MLELDSWKTRISLYFTRLFVTMKLEFDFELVYLQFFPHKMLNLDYGLGYEVRVHTWYKAREQAWLITMRTCSRANRAKYLGDWARLDNFIELELFSSLDRTTLTISNELFSSRSPNNCRIALLVYNPKCVNHNYFFMMSLHPKMGGTYFFG